MIDTPTPLPLDVMMSRSWELLKRNPAIAVPPLFTLIPIVIGLVLLVVWIVGMVMHGHRRDGGAALWAPFAIGYFVMLAVTVVVAVFGYAAMWGMANAAWERGRATLADGFAAARVSFWRLVVAFIGFFGLIIAAFILALPTLGISFIALMLFTIYVFPAVVVGGHGGFAAIAESFRLVRNYFSTSIVAALVLLAIQYGISFLSYPFVLPLQFAFMDSTQKGATIPIIPVPLAVLGGIGYLVILAALYVYQAFYALAIVGLYRSLVSRAAGDTVLTTAPVVAP